MHDLVRIEWHDSRGATAEWSRLHQLTDGTCMMESVGWIIHEDDQHVVLAPHKSTDEDPAEQQYCGVMYIPKSAITMTHHISRKLKAVAA